MFSSLTELVERLQQSPSVLGILRYGGRKLGDESKGGDFDLYVITTERSRTRVTNIESIHFYVNGIPVDMNIRTPADLGSETPPFPMDILLAAAEIIYDKQGTLEELLNKASVTWNTTSLSLNPNRMNWERFSQKHVLDKLRHRINQNVLLSQLLLNTNIYWLLCNYFLVRNIPYPGEGSALEYLHQNDPEIYDKMTHFYQCTDMEQKFKINEELTDLILEPANGPWGNEETLFLARDQEQMIAESDKQETIELLFYRN